MQAHSEEGHGNVLLSNARVSMDSGESRATQRALDMAHQICNGSPDITAVILHDGSHVKDKVLCNATIRFRHQVLESDEGRHGLQVASAGLPIGNGISIIDMGITSGQFQARFDEHADKVIDAFAQVQSDLKTAAHPMGDWCIGVMTPERDPGCRLMRDNRGKQALGDALNTRNAQLVVGAATQNGATKFMDTHKECRRLDDVIRCNQDAVVSAWQLRNDIAACAFAKLLELDPDCGIGKYAAKDDYDFSQGLHAMKSFVHRTHCTFSVDTGAFYGPDGTIEIRHGVLGPIGSSDGASAVYTGHLHTGEMAVTAALPADNVASNMGSLVDFYVDVGHVAPMSSEAISLLHTMDEEQKVGDSSVSAVQNLLRYTSSEHSYPISWPNAKTKVVNPSCMQRSERAWACGVPKRDTKKLFAEIFVLKNLKPKLSSMNAEWEVAHTLPGHPVTVRADADTIRAVMDAHDNSLPQHVARRFGDAEAAEDGTTANFTLPADTADRLRRHLVSMHWQTLHDTAAEIVEQSSALIRDSH